MTIHDKGKTFEIIVETLREIGYTVFEQVLNSRDFGVPQNRERIYIVAFRNDIAPKTFEFPTPIDDTKRIRDILEEKPVPAKYYLSECYMDTLRKHKARHEAKGNGFGYEIRAMDDVAGAIVCGGMGRERNLIIDTRQTDLTPTTHIKGEINKEGVRKMTPREWARLQGFPDNYNLVLADVHLYKQFGNSVTVPVIAAIAKKPRRFLIMPIWKFNRGDWSEAYVFLKLLGLGRIYGANADFEIDPSTFMDVIEILRYENKRNNDKVLKFNRNILGPTADISAVSDDVEFAVITFDDMSDYASRLYEAIRNVTDGKRKIEIPDIQAFLESIKFSSPKAPPSIIMI